MTYEMWKTLWLFVALSVCLWGIYRITKAKGGLG